MHICTDLCGLLETSHRVLSLLDGHQLEDEQPKQLPLNTGIPTVQGLQTSFPGDGPPFQMRSKCPRQRPRFPKADGKLTVAQAVPQGGAASWRGPTTELPASRPECGNRVCRGIISSRAEAEAWGRLWFLGCLSVIGRCR